MVDYSIKIQRLPFPVAGTNKIKELKKRREGKEENDFNEYIKDTMEKEKEKSSSVVSTEEKENVKNDEKILSTDHKEGTKIDITV